MKQNSFFKQFLTILILMIAVIAAAVILSVTQALPKTVVLFFAIFLLLALTIILLLMILLRSLKVTLYAYRNISLIAGILFVSVMEIVHTVKGLPLLLSDPKAMSDFYRDLISFPREFSFYAVFVIFFVCILLGISNIELIRKEGFRLHNALSLVVAALYIGGTVLIYFITDLLQKNVFVPNGFTDNPLFLTLGTVIPLFLLIILCYFECILVGSAVMGWLAARQVPAYDRDYIIILGCSIDKRGGLLPLLKGRVNRAQRFAWDQYRATGKTLQYIPSGGQGANEIMSEGSAMELYLLSHSAEAEEILPEKKSENTYQNFLFSKKIIDEQKPDAKVAFATTNYHMLRSGIIARKVELDAEGIAGDTKWYFWPNGFVREFFAILAMHKKAHLIVAGISALLCVAVGLLEYFGIAG